MLRGALAIGLSVIGLAIVAAVWVNNKAQSLRQSDRMATANVMINGVALAIGSDIISRDYGDLETHLKQAMADVRLVSVLVTDTSGHVLSHLRRASQAQAAQVIFDDAQITPPTDGVWVRTTKTTVEEWGRIDVGVPVGWIRLEVSSTELDNAVDDLRLKVSVTLVVASVLLLGALSAVLLRTRALIRMEEAELLDRNHELEQVAFRDSLTGLPNRHLLEDRIRQAMSYSKRSEHFVVICFMDLDGFKAVNDAYGHDAGDKVLCEMAERLTLCMRENDTVARLGGDEFVIVMTEVDTDHAYEEVLKRVLNVLEEPVHINGGIVATISASIGVTVYPNDNSDPMVLLEHADQAMYQAKRAGKNRWAVYRG